MLRSFVLRFVPIVAIIIVLLTVTVNAADYGCDVNVSTTAIYLQNLDTGTVVFEKNSNEKMYPASTTKIMTYIIVAENVSDLENTMVEVKEDAFTNLDPESSVMGLENNIGESFSVLELLYGMMVSSGNDAAWVLADFVGNGVENFVDLMNEKALQLGCQNTHFVNPHGLFDEEHYTTAQDLAIIAKYALNLPKFREITNTVTYNCRGIAQPLETTNYLIDSENGGQYYYQYAQGIKTGFTDEAGKCLVSTAAKDGYTYLCIALGAPYSYVDEINYAMLDTADIYEWAFNNLRYTTLYDESTVVKKIPVDYVWGDKTVSVVANESINALLPKEYDSTLVTADIVCTENASAPINKGDNFGTITVYYDKEKIGTAQLVASEDIDRDFTNYILHKLGDVFFGNIAVSVIVIVALIIFILLLRSHKRRKKAQRRRRYR